MIKDNGMSERVAVKACDVRSIQNSPYYDVIIAELMDFGGLGEHLPGLVR